MRKDAKLTSIITDDVVLNDDVTKRLVYVNAVEGAVLYCHVDHEGRSWIGPQRGCGLT